MRRRFATVFAATLLITTGLLGLPSANAVQETFLITLNPTTPDVNAPLQASGHCDNADAIGKQIHLSVFNILDADKTWEIDPIVDGNGNYSASYPAGWTDIPGFYQVVGLCPLQSVDLGYQASPVFTVAMKLTVQDMTASVAPIDPQFPNSLRANASGAGCQQGDIDWSILENDGREVGNGAIFNSPDANWTDSKTNNSGPLSGSALTSYASCTQDGQVVGLYMSTGGGTPTTTSTLPASTTTIAPTETTVPNRTAPAATAMASNPTYTG